MKKIILPILLFSMVITLMSFASAACVEPSDNLIISTDTTFCPGTYRVQNMDFGASGVTVTLNGTILTYNTSWVAPDQWGNIMYFKIDHNYNGNTILCTNDAEIHTASWNGNNATKPIMQWATYPSDFTVRNCTFIGDTTNGPERAIRAVDIDNFRLINNRFIDAQVSLGGDHAFYNGNYFEHVNGIWIGDNGRAMSGILIGNHFNMTGDAWGNGWYGWNLNTINMTDNLFRSDGDMTALYLPPGSSYNSLIYGNTFNNIHVIDDVSYAAIGETITFLLDGVYNTYTGGAYYSGWGEESGSPEHCYPPYEQKIINESILFCPWDGYGLHQGMIVTGSNIDINMNGAVFQGAEYYNSSQPDYLAGGYGFELFDTNNVTIRGGTLERWNDPNISGGVAIALRGANSNLTITDMFFEDNDMHIYGGTVNNLEFSYNNISYQHQYDQSFFYNEAFMLESLSDSASEIHHNIFLPGSGSVNIVHWTRANWALYDELLIHHNEFYDRTNPTQGYWFDNYFNDPDLGYGASVFPWGGVFYNNTFDGIIVNQAMALSNGDWADFCYADTSNWWNNGAQYVWWNGGGTPWQYNGFDVYGDLWAAACPEVTINSVDTVTNLDETEMTVTLNEWIPGHIGSGTGTRPIHFVDWWIDGTPVGNQSGNSYTFTNLTPDQEYNITYHAYQDVSLPVTGQASGSLLANATYSCTIPTTDMLISSPVTFCPGDYYVRNIELGAGATVIFDSTNLYYDDAGGNPSDYSMMVAEGDNIFIDCAGGTISGQTDYNAWEGTNGINLWTIANLTVQNCVLENNRHQINGWDDQENGYFENITIINGLWHGGGNNAYYKNIDFQQDAGFFWFGTNVFIDHFYSSTNQYPWVTVGHPNWDCCSDIDASGTMINSEVGDFNLGDTYKYNDPLNLTGNTFHYGVTLNMGGNNGQQFFYGNDVNYLDDWTDYGGGDYWTFCIGGQGGIGNTYSDGYYGGDENMGSCPPYSCYVQEMVSGCKWNQSVTMAGETFYNVSNTFTTTGGIIIDCAGATFIGDEFDDRFIDVYNDDITLKNCNFRSYNRLANINANTVVFDNINDYQHEQDAGCYWGCSQSTCWQWNPDTTEQDCTNWYGAEYWIGGECQHPEQCWQCGEFDDQWACPVYDEVTEQDLYWYSPSNFFDINNINFNGRNIEIKNSYIEGEVQLDMAGKQTTVGDGDYCAFWTDGFSIGDDIDKIGSQLVATHTTSGDVRTHGYQSFVAPYDMNVYGLTMYIDSFESCDEQGWIYAVLTEDIGDIFGTELNEFGMSYDTMKTGPRQWYFDWGSSFLTGGNTYYIWFTTDGSGGCDNVSMSLDVVDDGDYTDGTFLIDGSPTGTDLVLGFLTEDSTPQFIPDSPNCYWWDYNSNGATEEECLEGMWNSDLSRCEDSRLRYAGGNCVPWGGFNNPSCSDRSITEGYEPPGGWDNYPYFNGYWYACNVDDVADLNFVMENTIINRTNSWTSFDHFPFPFVYAARGVNIINNTWYYPESTGEHSLTSRFSGVENLNVAGNKWYGAKAGPNMAILEWDTPNCPSKNIYVANNEIYPTENGQAGIEMQNIQNAVIENNLIDSTGHFISDPIRLWGISGLGTTDLLYNVTIRGNVIRNTTSTNLGLLVGNLNDEPNLGIDKIYVYNNDFSEAYGGTNPGNAFVRSMLFYTNGSDGRFGNDIHMYNNSFENIRFWQLPESIDLCGPGDVGNIYNGIFRMNVWMYTITGEDNFYSHYLPDCDMTIGKNLELVHNQGGTLLFSDIYGRNHTITVGQSEPVSEGISVREDYTGGSWSGSIYDIVVRGNMDSSIVLDNNVGYLLQNVNHLDVQDPYYDYADVATFNSMIVPAPSLLSVASPTNSINPNQELSYSVETVAQISNCSLYLNGQVFDTKDGFGVNEKLNSFQIAMPGLAVRSHAWELICLDVFGNEVSLDGLFAITNPPSGGGLPISTIKGTEATPSDNPIDHLRTNVIQAVTDLGDNLQSIFGSDGEGDTGGTGGKGGVGSQVGIALVGIVVVIGAASLLSKP